LWKPISFEDKLLENYLRKNPGRLFLEVPLWFNVDPSKAKRIDGVLIPGEDTIVYPSGWYSLDELQKAVDNQAVRLIEAKRKLNRSVIGQLLVGKALFKRAFPSTNPIMVVVCAKGHADLEWFCSENEIEW
jgi:hypothetical protein